MKKKKNENTTIKMISFSLALLPLLVLKNRSKMGLPYKTWIIKFRFNLKSFGRNA